jgi:hypothetical protein
MEHRSRRSCTTMPNKKKIFEVFFYYIRIMINILIIFLHNIFNEKKWFAS